MIKTINKAGELRGKKVFMRADFDVPIVDGKITESFRIERQRETLQYLLGQGAKIVLAAHISAIQSFEPIKPQLEQLLDISFGDDVTLLENTRQNPGEKANDERFAQKLVDGCNLYVNNAFAVCHRAHASVVTAAKLIPAYAGFLIVEETTQLQKAIDAPAEGKIVIMGGAKAATKVSVIKHMMSRAERILVGGVVATDILKARGQDIGTSIADENVVELLAGFDINDPRLVVPDDFIRADDKILDIGQESAKRFSDVIRSAKMAIWNGPMGMFENARYAYGTSAVALAVSNAALSIVGGGDTIAAISKQGLSRDQFTFVSTGGGAMLTLLAGERLPGLEALGYYNA